MALRSGEIPDVWTSESKMFIDTLDGGQKKRGIEDFGLHPIS